jgi:hypothetical protein
MRRVGMRRLVGASATRSKLCAALWALLHEGLRAEAASAPRAPPDRPTESTGGDHHQGCDERAEGPRGPDRSSREKDECDGSTGGGGKEQQHQPPPRKRCRDCLARRALKDSHRD